MGNFYGGSTIIKGGKFASHDPADSGAHYTSQKKLSDSTQSQKQAKPRSKAKKPVNPIKLLEGCRKNLLHIIIDQMLLKRDGIKIPRSIHTDLQTALQAAGSPVEWAKSQDEFEALQTRKKKQREQSDLQDLQMQEALPVTVKVKIKKGLRTNSQKARPPTKEMPTEEDISKSHRRNLIRSFVDQMIKKQGPLTVPRLDNRLLEELKAAGSPLLWLQAQPSYEAVFKARYLAKQKARPSDPTPSAKQHRKEKKARKQKMAMSGVSSQNQKNQGKPKKTKPKNYYDPYEKPSRPVKPLGDVPVSYILKQLKKAGEDTLNFRRTDWNIT